MKKKMKEGPNIKKYHLLETDESLFVVPENSNCTHTKINRFNS